MEPIAQGSVQNTYKQFSYTLAAGASETIFYVFDYFRVLSYTGANNTLSIRWGGANADTDFISAGIGYKLNQAVDRVVLKNNDVVPVTIVFAVAVGTISDDRLNVSGTVNVNITGSVPLEILSGATAIYGTSTVGTSAVLISAAASDKKTVDIQNLGVLSTGANANIYVGFTSGVTAANGIKIPLNGFYSIDTAADVYVISDTASTDVRYNSMSA